MTCDIKKSKMLSDDEYDFEDRLSDKEEYDDNITISQDLQRIVDRIYKSDSSAIYNELESLIQYVVTSNDVTCIYLDDSFYFCIRNLLENSINDSHFLQLIVEFIITFNEMNKILCRKFVDFDFHIRLLAIYKYHVIRDEIILKALFEFVNISKIAYDFVIKSDDYQILRSILSTPEILKSSYEDIEYSQIILLYTDSELFEKPPNDILNLLFEFAIRRIKHSTNMIVITTNLKILANLVSKNPHVADHEANSILYLYEKVGLNSYIDNTILSIFIVVASISHNFVQQFISSKLTFFEIPSFNVITPEAEKTFTLLCSLYYNIVNREYVDKMKPFFSLRLLGLEENENIEEEQQNKPIIQILIDRYHKYGQFYKDALFDLICQLILTLPLIPAHQLFKNSGFPEMLLEYVNADNKEITFRGLCANLHLLRMILEDKEAQIPEVDAATVKYAFECQDVRLLCEEVCSNEETDSSYFKLAQYILSRYDLPE